MINLSMQIHEPKSMNLLIENFWGQSERVPVYLRNHKCSSKIVIKNKIVDEKLFIILLARIAFCRAFFEAIILLRWLNFIDDRNLLKRWLGWRGKARVKSDMYIHFCWEWIICRRFGHSILSSWSFKNFQVQQW